MAVDVQQAPVITFTPGADHAAAQALRYTGAFVSAAGGSSYTLGLSGLSGGALTIDHLVTVNKDPAVDSYRLQIGEALGSGLAPTNLKLRLWTGEIAPLLDNSPGVCAVLDLKAPAGTETSGTCTATAKMQVVYVLPSGLTSQSGSLTLRPSSVLAA